MLAGGSLFFIEGRENKKKREKIKEEQKIGRSTFIKKKNMIGRKRRKEKDSIKE